MNTPGNSFKSSAEALAFFLSSAAWDAALDDTETPAPAAAEVLAA